MIYLLFIILGITFAGIFSDVISGCIFLAVVTFFIYDSYKKYSLKKIILCFLLFMIGFSYYSLGSFIINNKYDNVETKKEQLSILVLSEPEYSDGSVKFIGKIDKYNKKANVTLRDTPYISYYDTLELDGYVYSLNSNKENYFSKGIYYKVTSYDKNIKIKEGKGFLKSINNLRNKVLYILDNNFSFESSMMLKGVMMGDDSLRTKEFDDALRKLSLSHVVSVSGMHFSIITMYILFIMRKLRIKRKISSLLTIPVVFMISLFIGFTPSVVRVLIMITILSLADLFDRDRVMDIHLLLLTAVIMLLFNIYYIHNIAFVLSFTSLGGILMYQKILCSKMKRIPKKISEAISVIISANIFSFPFIVYYFKGIPILSIIANLLIVPLISIIMICGTILVIISLINIKLGMVLGYPLDLLVSLCVKFINFTGNLPHGYFETLSLENYFILLYYSLIYICSLKIKGLYKNILALLLSLYFTINLFYPLDRLVVPYGNLYVMCGKNSGKNIITYKDKTLFVNASETNGSFNYKLIQDECNNYFDYYIAYNGDAIRYIDKYKINIGNIYVPEFYMNDIDFGRILHKYCEKIISVTDETDISFYDFVLTLKPVDEYNILETKVKHKDNTVVFTNGDINKFEFNTKYVVPYYSIDEYKDYRFLLNCLEDEVERIKIWIQKS